MVFVSKASTIIRLIGDAKNINCQFVKVNYSVRIGLQCALRHCSPLIFKGVRTEGSRLCHLYSISGWCDKELSLNHCMCAFELSTITLQEGETQVTYMGKTNSTLSGRTCQRWTETTPHFHTKMPERYPDAGLGDHNFCRDPDGTGECTECLLIIN